jgi:peptidyl-prolyl cis-trans isomerase SurA
MRRLLTFFVISIISSVSIAQQMVDGVVAMVGQEIILKSEVEQYAQSYVIQNKINVVSNPEILNNLKKEVLERLIEQKILLTKADEDTIVAADREVDRYLEEQIRTMVERVGSEAQLEAAFDSPIKKIRRDMRKEIESRLKIETLRRKKFQDLKISRREVEEFYAAYKDSLPSIKETIDISHILKQVKPGGASADKGLTRILEIKQKLDAGADFNEMAKEYSEDPATAARGGDLGFIKRGDLVKEYEEVAFNMEPGQISDVVQSQFGYHLIKLIEKRGEKVNSAHILIQLKPTEEDENRVVGELEEIRGRIIGGESFETLAVEFSDDENVVNDKGHLGTWELDKLAIPEIKAIVSNMQAGDISQPFKTSYGYHIVRLNMHNQPRLPSLEEDWEEIKNMALNYKMEKAYRDWITVLREDIPIEYKISFN